jgi:hypothetical protein
MLNFQGGKAVTAALLHSDFHLFGFTVDGLHFWISGSGPLFTEIAPQRTCTLPGFL